MDPACWLWEKDPGFQNQVPKETSSHLLLLSRRPTTGRGTRSTSSWAHKNLSWQLSRDWNSHGSGMSQTTTASPNPSFKVPLRMGIAMVSRGSTGWATLKSGHPCPCQHCWQWLPAGKAGRGSLLNHLLCPSNYAVGQRTELNWKLLYWFLFAHLFLIFAISRCLQYRWQINSTEWADFMCNAVATS